MTQEDRDNVNNLIYAYDNYIKLLVDELNELIGIVYVHRWTSNRVEAGIVGRKQIEEAKSELVN